MVNFPVGDTAPFDNYPIIDQIDGTELFAIENKGTLDLYVPISAIVGMANSDVYDSVADVRLATIPTGVDAIRTAGYYAAGDLGSALYKRVTVQPTHSGKIQSVDGAWWELAEAIVTPQMFGTLVDPAENASIGLDAWLTYLLTIGGEGLVPAVSYYMSTGVVASCSASTSIVCSSGAKFIAASGFPHSRMFLIGTGTGSNHSFKWHGGAFDATNQPNSLAGEANDIFSFNAENCTFCDIFLDQTTAGADWLTSGSDSHLFIGGAKNVRAGIGHCLGATDAGMYISSSADGNIGQSLYAYGSYEKCLVGVIVKRQFETWTIDINSIDCLNGGGAGTALSGSGVIIPPGDGGVIRVNALRTERAAFLQGVQCANVNVTTLNMGVSIVGYTSTTAIGCYASGSNHVTGIVNATGYNSACTVNTNFLGVKCDRRLIDVVNYDATDNYFIINSDGIGRAFAEDANSDRNTFVVKEINSVSAAAITGALSTMVRFLSSVNGIEYDSPMIALGGTHNAEAVRITKTASQVNFLSFVGAIASGIPSIQTAGSDTTVNMSIIPKGTGVLLLGGGAGAESLRVAKGVSSGNAVEIDGVAAGSSPVVKAHGADTNIDLTLSGKGTGGVVLTVTNTGLHVLDTNASHDLIIAPGSDLTADHTLTLTTGDADRTVTLSGNPTLNDWFDQSLKAADSPSFAQVRATADTGGVVSTTTLTNGSDVSANSTGVGVILMKGATGRNSAGFAKIYIGTTAYYIPLFDAITG